MDEKSIKILESIIMFGPITGPDILSFLKKNNIDINIKTIYTIVDKWNYLFSHIGDGTMQIVGQKKIGYYLNHPYFSIGQQQFLKDAITSSVLLDSQEKENLSQLISIFPKNIKKHSNDGFLNRLNTIAYAITEKKALKFSYIEYYIKENGKSLSIEKRFRQSGNDNAETYLISPYEIVMNRGQYYVLSYCDKHPDTITIFRLDRMEKVRTVKNEYFEHLKEIIDYETTKSQMIHMYVGQETVENIRIKFKKEIFKTIIDEFGKNITLSKDVDGSYILELRDFAISEGLIGWIMMMGDNVEVISPKTLKDNLYQRLKSLLEKYKK